MSSAEDISNELKERTFLKSFDSIDTINRNVIVLASLEGFEPTTYCLEGSIVKLICLTN